MYDQAEQIRQIVDNATKIVIIQADNPDADSLGSALAFEQILHELAKEPYLYCAVDIPSYLRYMSGWDRVNKDIAHQFDASIIVDASTMTLLEKLSQSSQAGWVASKPCIVIDHHEVVENQVPFATVKINDSKRASAGELIYMLAKQLNWPLNKTALEFLMISILGDTQGLSNQLTTPETYRIMAEMLEAGVDRPALEELRREYSKMPRDILQYKAELIKKCEFSDDGSVAIVSIPQIEINAYSPLYNPAPLIQGDLLQTIGVKVAIVLKKYDDGKITGAVRSTQDFPIAAQLAEHFGGGGHKFASGFKLTDNSDFNKLKSDTFTVAKQLLRQSDETIQQLN